MSVVGGDKVIGMVFTRPGATPKSITGEDLRDLVKLALIHAGKAAALKVMNKILGRAGLLTQVFTAFKWKQGWEMHAQWTSYTSSWTIGGSLTYSSTVTTITEIYFETPAASIDEVNLPTVGASTESIADSIKNVIDGVNKP